MALSCFSNRSCVLDHPRVRKLHYRWAHSVRGRELPWNSLQRGVCASSKGSRAEMSNSRKVTITNRIVSEQGIARETAHRALKVRLETIAVHAGAEIDPVTGSVAPPLHLSTTFEHGAAGEAIHEFSISVRRIQRSRVWKPLFVI